MNANELFYPAVDLLAKSSGILLLAFAVNSLRRSASAAQRCLAWGAAFVVLLLLPLTLQVPPRWSIALGHAPSSPPLPATVLHFKEAWNNGDANVNEDVSEVRPRRHVDPARLMFLGWIAGAMLVLVRRVLGGWQVRRLHAQSRAFEEGRIAALVLELAREAGIRRRISCRESAHVSVPLTWGVFRPVLLLPRQALSWSDASLEAAMRHELGHIRHGDALTRLAACVVSAIFWPNALVWLAAKSWRTAQEQACDDLVLRAGAAKQDYAMQLLDTVRGVKEDPCRHAPVMAMARPSTLEARLSAIMDDTRDRRPLHHEAWFAGSGAAVLALMLCAALQVRAQEKPAPKGGETLFIEFSTKILEVTRGKDSGASPLDGLMATRDKPIIMTSQKAEAFVAQLSRKKGVDLLSAPRVTTKDGQQATIEVTRDFLTPHGKPDATPKNQKVGVFLTLLPNLNPKDGLEITMEGMVREFEGYHDDPDSGKKVPLFSERKTEFLWPMQSGEAALLRGKVRLDGELQREVIYLIRADVAPQSEASPLNNHGSATITPDGKVRAATVNSPRSSEEHRLPVRSK